MTLVVVRMLSPDDYGLMAELQIFVNFLLGFGSLGLGDALIQQNDTPKAVVARVFGVLLLTSAGFTVLLVLAAYPIADWYHDPRLVPLIQVVSLGFLFNGLTALPRVYLTKSLQLRSMLIIDLSSGFFGAALVIALAYGYGVWALMLGWLTSNVLRLLGFVTLQREYYVWPRFNFDRPRSAVRVRHLPDIGVHGVAGVHLGRRADHQSLARADSIGRLRGRAELRRRTAGRDRANREHDRVSGLRHVLQGRPAEAQFAILKALRMMATIAVPVFFGICATAPEVVDLVFGPKWVEAKSVLGVLAVATTFRAILIMIPNYLQGIGDLRAGFWCTATGAVIFPPAFVVGCHWGIEGVAYGWLIGYPVVFAINALITSRRGGVDFGALMLAPIRPMVVGVIMMAAVAAVRLMLPDGLPRIGYFAVLVAVGAATYCAVLFSLFRDLAMEMLRIVYRAPSVAR